jgi:predicted nucleic acid-binding protein
VSISKLHLFSKNTDASASIRGYNYQTLKTLETWLDNLLNKVDEEIYCDFEEDIFQKDYKVGTAKFRQLKLYSSNFSFKSEEIEKCISHFFLLHVKTDYQLLDKEFVFEANTSVAGTYKDNDAELLRKWVLNQLELSDDLLKSCSDKVKSIVAKYISRRAEELKNKVDDFLIKEAVLTFEALTEKDWIDFTKKIKWRFADREPDEEFSVTISQIESLISRLPYKIDKDYNQAVFGVLYKEVSLKASNQAPEQRKLTTNNLEILLINSGDKEDKWYVEVFESWKDIRQVEYFRIGEFYEIINASRHCRRHNYLSNHDAHWLTLLLIFINKLTLRKEYRKEAIYEYLWLRFRPEGNFNLPKGDLLGSEKLIRFYFSDFTEFKHANALEDAKSLLQITFTAKMSEKVKINFNEIISWYKQLYLELNKQLKAAENPNEKCHLLELLGTLVMFFNQRKKTKKNPNDFIKYFEELLTIIDTAPYYHTSQLSDRINKYINLFIKINADENAELIIALQLFSEKLHSKVQNREGEFSRGKKQVDWGAGHIYTDDPTQVLKALSHFHKAKNHWNNRESIEGHVLSLLNIAQLYSSIGLNFAAKYYALGGVWVSINNGDKKLLKRIADSLALIFYSDFKQGSWLSAISSFHLFLVARHEFNPNQIDLQKDSITFKSIGDFSFILLATPKISEQFKVLIDSIIKLTGYVGEEFIIPLVESMKGEISSVDKVKELCEKKLDDFPLNDSGKTRIIRFHSLGSLWVISFQNDYRTNSIAEEFLALLQIMLAEISLSDYDFHFLKGKIEMELVLSTELSPPEQLPSNSEYKWKVFVEYFDAPDPKKINMHTARNSTSLFYVLNEISLLKEEEFKEMFARLFNENGLAEKTLSTNAYQRIYRQLINDKEFARLQREHFLPVPLTGSFPSKNNVMQWKSELSSKYNHHLAIEHIKNRFKNSYDCIHLTLAKHKGKSDFNKFINGLRSKGFLDWQIILAFMNFIIDYKVQLELRDDNTNFKSEEEYVEAVQRTFHKYLHMDEKEFPVDFPLEAFETPDFLFQLRNYPVNVLRSFELENKSRFPNLEAIKEFLDIRFNMKNDDDNTYNPLKDIEL